MEKFKKETGLYSDDVKRRFEFWLVVGFQKGEHLFHYEELLGWIAYKAISKSKESLNKAFFVWYRENVLRVKNHLVAISGLIDSVESK